MTDFQLSTAPYVALASRKEVRAPSDCPIHLVVYARSLSPSPRRAGIVHRVRPVLGEGIHWRGTMLVPQSTGARHGGERGFSLLFLVRTWRSRGKREASRRCTLHSKERPPCSARAGRGDTLERRRC